MSHLRTNFSGVSVPIGAEANNSQAITNNVVIQRSDSNKKDIGVTYGEDVKEVSEGVYVINSSNPYKDIPTRDLESAKQRLDIIKNAQPDNDKLIQALSLIIDMLYSNPIYINKFVIPGIDTLTTLIKLLTDANEVEITFDSSVDCGCCSKESIAPIDTIYVKKDNVIAEFKYAYAEAKQILESNHISTKLVTVA